MADTNQSSANKCQEMKTELNRSASGEPLPDPKSIHDLTQYLLVDSSIPKARFSKYVEKIDEVIRNSIAMAKKSVKGLLINELEKMLVSEKSRNLSHKYVQSLLQQMQDKFQIMSDQILARIDDMGHRIDDLEKNIGDLMTQAGVEETDK